MTNELIQELIKTAKSLAEHEQANLRFQSIIEQQKQEIARLTITINELRLLNTLLNKQLKSNTKNNNSYSTPEPEISKTVKDAVDAMIKNLQQNVKK